MKIFYLPIKEETLFYKGIKKQGQEKSKVIY